MPRDKRVDHRRLQRRMIGIVVSPAAYAAIGTDLTGVDVERERALNGDYSSGWSLGRRPDRGPSRAG